MSTELEEALTAAQVGPLIQKRISPMLLEYQRRYAPLLRALPSEQWNSSVYYFNTRTSRVPGGFVSDGGARPVGASVYTQNQFTIRLLQAVGSVTGYAQEVTRAQIGDLRAKEIDGAVQSLLWDIENGICWGSDGATNLGPYPQFDSLDVQAGQFAGSGGSAAQNALDWAGAGFSLGLLDQLVDLVETNAAQPIMGPEWMFVMSTTANSRLAQLLTNQQRFVESMGAGTIGRSEVAAGLIVPTYRDIPILKSSFLNARNLSMGTVTAATATTGGTLAAATYRYCVSAVMARMGEIAASAEVTQATTGSASTVTLSFTPPAAFEQGAPILYKVYRSTAGAGTTTLLGFVDANVGLQADGITPIVATSIVDTGAALVPQNGATVPANTPAAYVGTNTGHKPRTAGLEDIYLVSRDSDNVVRPYVRDIRPVEVYPTTAAPDTLPFALVSDTCLAVRAPKYLARARNLLATLAS